MDKSNKPLYKICMGLLPLCICLTATALMIQNAHDARGIAFAQADEIPSLMEWISPIAVIFLILGYLTSALVLWCSIATGGFKPGGKSDRRTDQ